MDYHDESLATLEERWQVDCRSNIETGAAPTVMPTTQATQKSPAPLAGFVLGLGTALVLARMRR